MFEWWFARWMAQGVQKFNPTDRAFERPDEDLDVIVELRLFQRNDAFRGVILVSCSVSAGIMVDA
jgi:hypothetical protein